MKNAMMRIRKMTQADLAPLYQLYLAQEKQIPYQPKTRFAQFAADLRTSRSYPDTRHYEPKAEIAVVAEVGGEIVAYADGCKVNEARGLVKDNQAFIRMVIGSREHADAAKKVIRRVTQHLLKFSPDTLQAFSSYIAPVFRGFAGGKLHSEWSWLGQCLVDEGYVADGFGLRMYRPLTGRGHKPPPHPRPPRPGRCPRASRSRPYADSMPTVCNTSTPSTSYDTTSAKSPSVRTTTRVLLSKDRVSSICLRCGSFRCRTTSGKAMRAGSYATPFVRPTRPAQRGQC